MCNFAVEILFPQVWLASTSSNLIFLMLQHAMKVLIYRSRDGFLHDNIILKRYISCI
ncbi:hypothetical protein Mapa_005811 [Marchantia paleacea]|nr:hypothetical protein Mapa_005811 [Marchantia paleacea]